MKKFIFLLTALIFTFSFTSCNDDEELLNNDNEEPQEYIAPLPTEDLMVESVKVPTAVIGSDFDPVTSALIRRLKSRDNEITPNTQCVIIESGFIPYLSQSQKKDIKELYDRGGSIMLSEPEMRLALDFSSSLGKTSALGIGEGENAAIFYSYDVYIFNNHNDEYFVQNINDPYVSVYENESSGDEEFSNDSNISTKSLDFNSLEQLSPYDCGLRADKIAVWLNENSTPDISSRASVQETATAQRVTIDVYPKANFPKVEGRSGAYTIIYEITSLYSFSQDIDYYAVHQEIIGSNSAMNMGNWKDGEYYYGLYLGNITCDHKLLDHNDTTPASTVIQTTSPATTENARSETVGMSFSIGGDVGLSTSGPSAGVSGGFSYSESYTVNIPDVSIANQCKSDDSHVNARWVYNTAAPAPTTNFWGYLNGFSNAPEVATNTIDVHNTWLWAVSHPSSSYKMKCINEIHYDYRHGENNVFTYTYGTHTYWTTYTRWINLDAPNRTKN